MGVQSRVSSGLSGITNSLRETLMDSGHFKSVVYIEAEDLVQRTRDEYVGVLRSVNDIQSQLGEKKFGMFLDDVHKIGIKVHHIFVCYSDRAWIASNHEWKRTHAISLFVDNASQVPFHQF